MKYFTILLSCSLLCFGCHKEDPVSVQDDPFTILPSSGNFLSPYYGKDKVIFEDSLGHELAFKVAVTLSKPRTYIWNFYNVNVPGDTVQKSFLLTGDLVTLTDDSNQHMFTLEIFPELYIPKSDSNTVKAIDRFTIFFYKASYPHVYSVFTKILNLRGINDSLQNWSSNVLEPNQSFLGLSFSNVEHTGYSNPKALAYYNNTFGMVAFFDYNHTLWRLK